MRAFLLVFAALAAWFAAGCSRPGASVDAHAPTPAGHYADLRGLRMYYEVHGTGRPLLLLHGGAGNGEQFSNQVPEFSRVRRVIVPDACAQGRTSDRPGPFTYHEMAEDVVALMDHLKIARADIMGWSDGGNLGLDIAMHHPGRVDHLVTFGANARPDGLNAPDRAWADTATVRSFGPGMEEGWKKLAPDTTRYEAAMTKILALWRTQPNFTAEDLGRIRAKVLVCAGDHDVIRRDHTEWIAHAIPGARLWIVPDASHGAMLEKPALVNARVLEFLAR